MIHYLVNNIRLLQILTIISATITIFLEIYFIVKNIKKKYEKFVYKESKKLKEDTVINIIPDDVVPENDKNQEIITTSNICYGKSRSIFLHLFESTMKNPLIELKFDITRNCFTFFTNEKMLFMDIPIYGMIDFYKVLNSNLLGFTKVNKEVGKDEIDNNIIQSLEETGITKSYPNKYWIYEKDYFERDYAVKIFNDLEKMDQLSKRIIIVGNSNMMFISIGESSSVLIKATDKCNGESYEREKIILNGYNNCNFINANICCTINTTQNNEYDKDELNSIIDLIEKNLEKLNQEQAEDLQDTLSMVVEEFNNGTPRVGRLKKCITLLAPMLTVTNGIPVLAENLQKLYDYILPYIK